MTREPTSAAMADAGSNDWRDELVDLYATRRLDLVRLTYLLTGRAAVAEELVQDVFVRVNTSWDGARPPYPYVRASVVNACRSWGRHQQVVRAKPSPAPEPSVQHPDELWDALERLDPQRRAAVVLRFYGDLPHGEIARLLGIGVVTVRTTIHRALRQLRQELAE